MFRSRRDGEPPSPRRIGAVVVVLGIIGLAVFVYADMTSNRPLRLGAVLMVSLAVLTGMALALLRNGRMKAAPRKRS